MASPAVRLVQQFIGQENTITIPRSIVQLTGDYVSAAVLCQLLYWHSRVGGKEFYKTDEELCGELAISQKQLRRARNVLAEFGVATVRKGIPARLFYVIDLRKLENKLLPLGTTGDDQRSQQVTDQRSQQVINQRAQLIHKITTEDYTKEKPTSVDTDAPPSVEILPPPEMTTPPDLASYYLAWNQNCGALSKSYNNKQATKLLRGELKTRTPLELEHAITYGARAVAADPYWLEKGFGFVNLLRNLDSKAEKYQSGGGLSGANAKAYQRAQRLAHMQLGSDD